MDATLALLAADLTEIKRQSTTRNDMYRDPNDFIGFRFVREANDRLFVLNIMPDKANDSFDGSKQRLSSWKQIAGYFGNDPRTVQRWEEEGLPVYREGGKVFAYAEDLAEWRRRRTIGPQSDATGNPVDDRPKRFIRPSVIKIGVLLTLTVALLAAYLRIPWHQPTFNANEKRQRRLFAGATSEGRSPRRLRTGQTYRMLLMAPDGKQLYGISVANDRFFTVIGVEDLLVKRTFRLPLPPRTAFLSRNGKHIYISSIENGVMVVNTAVDGGVERVISTSTPAFDVAVSPDERTLFLAMGYSGLHRINLRTGERHVLSPLACPAWLNITPTGKRLYVSYQCGGPGGSRGHDTIAVYDVNSEKRVDVIGGLAMVGGRPLFAPQDEDVVLLDSVDACSSSDYDHIGCATVPSHPFYLWSASDHRLITTFSFPADLGAGVSFQPETRLVSWGATLRVWDWARQMSLETMTLPKESFGPVAITPSGSRAFASTSNTTGLMILDAEKEECLPPIHGLVNFYAGDGTQDDSQGSSAIKFGEHPKFAPGLMGQAFDLNGATSFLLARNGAAFCNFCINSWSTSFFIKFHSTDGEMTVLERETTDPVWDFRLFKAKDNHVVLTSRGEVGSKFNISSDVRVDADKWYHLALVTGKDRRSLFINGVLQREQHISATIDPPMDGVDKRNIFFGATQGKRDFLNGLIDEVAVYSRALTPGEVAKISGTCGAR